MVTYTPFIPLSEEPHFLWIENVIVGVRAMEMGRWGAVDIVGFYVIVGCGSVPSL